jgi:hypothetical protein
MIDPGEETVALLSYLEQRKMTEGEAAAVMGMALEALMRIPIWPAQSSARWRRDWKFRTCRSR